MRTIFILTLILFPIVLFSQSGKRLALVIGNAKYQYGNSLKNPGNDAELMARTLKSLKFEVIKKINATRKEMNEAIVDFSKRAKDCDVTLFYYAGHGIQVDGVNYIIPVDSKIDDPISVQFEALNMHNIVAQFEYYDKKSNIVILDACRENPFLSWVRGNLNSYAAMPAPVGTIIAFSTGNGAVAYDNIAGGNGLYTGVLANQLLIPQRIEDVFINTRNEVFKLSEGKQQPQEWSQLSGVFYLTEKEVILNDTNSVKYEDGKLIVYPVIDGKLYFNTKLIGNIAKGKNYTIDHPAKGMNKIEIKGASYWIDSVYIDELALNNLSNEKKLHDIQKFSNSNKGEFYDNRDKNKYSWVKIGKQIWMAENLKTYIDDINSFANNYKKSNIETMGMLYTWEGALKACPAGWHLPSEEDYTELFEFLGNNEELGSKLKSSLSKDATLFYWGNRGKIPTTNSSGFNALAIGVSKDTDVFLIQNCSAHFWTSSSYGQKNAVCMQMWSHNNNVGFDVLPNSCALSVRCLKDK
jgi:uncharacterized protein (TIGR02145 family)